MSFWIIGVVVLIGCAFLVEMKKRNPISDVLDYIFEAIGEAKNTTTSSGPEITKPVETVVQQEGSVSALKSNAVQVVGHKSTGMKMLICCLCIGVGGVLGFLLRPTVASTYLAEGINGPSMGGDRPNVQIPLNLVLAYLADITRNGYQSGTGDFLAQFMRVIDVNGNPDQAYQNTSSALAWSIWLPFWGALIGLVVGVIIIKTKYES